MTAIDLCKRMPVFSGRRFLRATDLRVDDSTDLSGVLLVSSVIEVFVHSHGKDIDVGHYREMSYHWECGLAQWAYGELAAQFKGRILSEEDVGALRQLLEMAKKENSQVRVYDISRMSDRVRALKRGVLKTPTAIIGGVPYQGLDAISHVIAGGQNR